MTRSGASSCGKCPTPSIISKRKSRHSAAASSSMPSARRNGSCAPWTSIVGTAIGRRTTERNRRPSIRGADRTIQRRGSSALCAANGTCIAESYVASSSLARATTEPSATILPARPSRSCRSGTDGSWTSARYRATRGVSTVRRRRCMRAGCGHASATTDSVTAGCRLGIDHATCAPSPCPTIVADDAPSERTTPATSRVRVSTS